MQIFNAHGRRRAAHANSRSRLITRLLLKRLLISVGGNLRTINELTRTGTNKAFGSWWFRVT
jgi:hypothetical protein